MPGSVKERSISKQSKTKWLLSDPNELSDGINLILREEKSGNYSNLYNAKSVAIADKLIKHKRISTKQCSFATYMTKLNEKYDVDRSIRNCDFKRISPAEASKKTTTKY